MEEKKITERDLRGYTALVCELEREQESYYELMSSLEGTAVRYDREPCGTGIGKPTENRAIKCAEAKKRLDRVANDVRRISGWVEAVEDPVVRVAIKYIYFDGISLTKTAKVLKRNRNALSKQIKACIGK